MKRLFNVSLLMLAICCIASSVPAWAQFDYSFSASTGKAISPPERYGTFGLRSGANNWDGGSPGVYGIGLPFPFIFDGQEYYDIYISAFGHVGFGGISGSNSNDLTGESSPVLAAFWDAMRLASRNGATIWYGTDGEAPYRVFVINYDNLALGRGTDGIISRITFQIRLYEECNRIEFYYENMDPTNVAGWAGGSATSSGSIGISNGKDFISVTPEEKGVSISSTKANNDIDLQKNLIEDNTLYTFTPAGISLIGNTSEGGTSTMGNGDQLLSGKRSQRYLGTSYLPFSMQPYSGCLPANFTFTISGPAAADYKISPASGTMKNGEVINPVVTFTPSGIGFRDATLTFSDGTTTRSYSLIAEGLTRITWTGNVAEGGTTGLVNGKDILLNNMRVLRKSVKQFKPVSFMVATNKSAPNAPITVTIIDSTGLDQYKIINSSNAPVNSTTFSLTPGSSFAPSIQFSPIGVGYQKGSITFNAEGEIRTFPLNAYSIAPGGEFYIGSLRLSPTSQIFQKDFICVGESVQSYPVDIPNIGDGMFNINKVDILQTDSIYGQGVPRYALLRDNNGKTVPLKDYFFSVDPGIAPLSPATATQFPIQVPYLTTTRAYLNFVPQFPGKRFARMFIYTNGENFTGVDPDGKTVEGLLVIDVFGRGLGSFASDPNNNALPKTVAFPQTAIGKTSLATVNICNTGACDLRIGKKQFRVINGDVKEFKIVDAFGGIPIDANPNNETWVLSPDSCASITFSFTPSRSGSRRVSVQLQTNDSSLASGNTERGAYYWDLVGTGSVGIETRDVAISPAVIDGPTTEYPSSSAMAENTTNELVVIEKIVISGTDASEFSMNPSKPWPGLPFAIQPGQSVELSVVHTPSAGSQPGPRSGELLLITSTGDTMVVKISGEAGIRTLSAAPSSLFDNVTVAVGKVARQTVMITNSGTLPVKLGTTTITGPTSTDYTLGRVPRTTIAPGQTEYLEVTYRPLNRGVSSGVLTINSNGTNGALTVQLGGTATKLGGEVGPGGGVSGSEELSEVGGLKLWQSRPNPGRDMVEIRYSMELEGMVELVLYNERGEEVQVLDRGERVSGDHGVVFNVSGLASGTYHYRLVSGGETVVRTLTIVK